MTCIEDYSDSTMRGIRNFYEALSHVSTLHRPVRIAYFGDSFIEADILTADLREMLQTEFGGCGVGYVPITSSINFYRQTVVHSFDGWDSYSVVENKGFDYAKQDLSGRYFLPHAEAFVQLKGQSKYASRLDTCYVSTLYFKGSGEVEVLSKVNGIGEGELHEKVGDGSLQSISVEGKIGQIRWSVEKADSAVFYGVAMDGKRGVCVDNFSMRSSSGLQLATIPLKTLQEFNHLRQYDLIIIQYGLNVATKFGYNYDNYKTGMVRGIEHLKTAFPQAGVLIIGMADREYRNEDGELRTMPGVINLIDYQQTIAIDEHIAFWSMYDAMGGEGSIVRMANEKTANLDYTHINYAGGKYLAGLLFETLMYGKEQYEKRKKYEED